jgi:hypothetical protein
LGPARAWIPDWLRQRLARPAPAEVELEEVNLSETPSVTDELDQDGLESFDLTEPAVGEPGAPAAAYETPDEDAD